jgi:transketolase
MTIAKFKLHNLIAVVDSNGIQSGGPVNKVSGLVNLPEKWKAFGWCAVEVDGHNLEQLTEALENAAKRGRADREQRKEMRILPNLVPPDPDQPVILIAHTIKGRGVPFMEGNNAWHKRVPNDEERELAMSILGGSDLE